MQTEDKLNITGIKMFNVEDTLIANIFCEQNKIPLDTILDNYNKHYIPDNDGLTYLRLSIAYNNGNMGKL